MFFLLQGTDPVCVAMRDHIDDIVMLVKRVEASVVVLSTFLVLKVEVATYV